MRITWSILFRITVSLGLIYFIFRKMNFLDLAEVFKKTDLNFLALSLFSLFLALVIGTYKWQILANSVFGTTVSFITFFRYYLIGFFYSLFVPGGLIVGEVVKSFRIVRGRIQKNQLVLSVVADRVTGFVALGVLMLLAFILGRALWDDRISQIALIVSFGGGLVGFFIFFSQLFSNFLFFLGKWFTKLINANWNDKLLHLEQLFFYYHARKKLVSQAILLSGFSHFFWALAIFFAANSLGFTVAVSYFVWIYLISGILFFLPVSYAGFGLREGAFIYFLSLIGIPSEAAIAIALLFLGLQIITALTGGGFELQELYATTRKINFS